MKLASKSKNRIAILDMIQDGISKGQILEGIDFRSQSEDKIQQFIYPNLINQLTDHVMDKKGFSRSLAIERAKTMVKWDGNTSSQVRNIQFMGTTNKPHMTLKIEGINIAIEIKKGNRGSALREGIGQSMIYSTIFDFVLYLFIDTSEDRKILNGSSAITEENFLNNIWDNFNIKYNII